MPPQEATPPAQLMDDSEPALKEPLAEKLLNRAVHPSTKYETHSTWRESLRGAVYIAWMLLAPFLDLIWVILPTQLFLRSKWLFGPRAVWPQKLLQWLEEMFFSMLSGLLEIGGGMEFVVTTDDEDLTFAPEEQVLLLCNHRTEIDWIFFWNLAIRFNCHGRIRVMMKSMIRYLPGPGWAMLLLDYPYVSRKWETDQARLTHQLQTYKQSATGVWLCMFPEGTALFRKTLERSHAFAKERAQTLWDYVLIPRVRGFQLCVDEMEPDCVLDITVGYPELQAGVRPSPLRLLRGQFPTAVHVHLSKHSNVEIAMHKGSMDQWLTSRFQAKEDRLRKFYETGAFEGHRMTSSHVNISMAVAKGMVFHSLLCMWTLASWYNFPLVTLGWFSFCITIVTHRIQAFGE